VQDFRGDETVAHRLIRAHLTVAKHDLPLRELRDVMLVRDDHDRQTLLLVEFLEDLHHLDGCAAVEVSCRFVRVGPRLAETCPADVLDSFNVHCLGALRATQATLPWLQRAPRPAIVNISSRRGSLAQEAAGGAPGDASYAYRIAKAAQNMLTVCLSVELRHAGIPVLAVHPGALLTGTAPPDAAVAPRLAARRILALAEQADRAPALFLEPPDRTLPW
jgi:NAD(P)-dependent dehydrogenase (short-subunit alcohol dehydrogenase family)